MKIAIIVFPGSNCDRDCGRAVQNVLGVEPQYIWHKDHDLQSPDAVIIPGGFSYGDYLRCGSIAQFSPIMNQVLDFAKKGGSVLGICNGFQILTECGLLPGALMRNKSLHFICDTVELKLQNQKSVFTKKGDVQKTHRIPIAHMDGNYFIDENGLKKLQDNDQIVLRYQHNPNGSVDNIAGIQNKEGNVLGMMPHPERVCDDLLGGTDGRFVFEGLVA
ncbi:MAG: phosphoribosylformylglycinamidine synthase subunit PurQ [Deltaproteobacteria bacterium]|nr:phosphoribosylformylglycinamidine synthase subunit PurQ [Deltaproteobacteria bacterium]